MPTKGKHEGINGYDYGNDDEDGNDGEDGDDDGGNGGEDGDDDDGGYQAGLHPLVPWHNIGSTPANRLQLLQRRKAS